MFSFVVSQMGGNPFGGPNMDAMAAFGFPGPNMNPQVTRESKGFLYSNSDRHINYLNFLTLLSSSLYRLPTSS